MEFEGVRAETCRFTIYNAKVVFTATHCSFGNTIRHRTLTFCIKMKDWTVTLTLRDSSLSMRFLLWAVFVASRQCGRYGSEGAWSGTEWSARNVRKRNGTWTLSFARRKICGLSHEPPALNSCSSTGVVTSFNVLKYRHCRASRITLQLTARHVYGAAMNERLNPILTFKFTMHTWYSRWLDGVVVVALHRQAIQRTTGDFIFWLNFRWANSLSKT